MILAFTSMWICLCLGILLSWLDMREGKSGFAWPMAAMKSLSSARR